MCTLHNHPSQHEQGYLRSGQSIWASCKAPLVALGLGVAAVAGYYLWVYHSKHVLAVLPFLFVLACPLMHLLMHRKHGQKHQPQHSQSGSDDFRVSRL